jgi:hypothetical protein
MFHIHALKEYLNGYINWFYLQNMMVVKVTETCRVKEKVKFTLEQAMKAQRGSRDVAVFFP